jgi:hypothetical protein
MELAIEWIDFSAPSRPSPDIIETDIPARLDALPWGRFHVQVVVALGVTWILDGLEVTMTGALSGVLKESATLGLSNAEIGLAASAYLVAHAAGDERADNSLQCPFPYPATHYRRFQNGGQPREMRGRSFNVGPDDLKFRSAGEPVVHSSPLTPMRRFALPLALFCAGQGGIIGTACSLEAPVFRFLRL